MIVRRFTRLAFCAALGVGALTAAPVAPATQAATTYSRTVEPTDPANPPTAPPIVNLTAACVRYVGGVQLEAIFGYHHTGMSSIVIDNLTVEDPGANVIVRDRYRLREPRRQTFIEAAGPQVTLFKPGVDPHAFAVRFNIGETVAWKVRVPTNELFLGPSWTVTVRPSLLSPCPAGVPARFAVVQAARVSMAPANVISNDQGHVQSYELQAAVSDVRVVCSGAGTPVGYHALVGWETATSGNNLVPLTDVAYVVEVPGRTWEMSPTLTRAAVDVTEETVGLNALADVVGTCQFGSSSVTGDEFWAQQAGPASVVPTTDANGNVVGLGTGSPPPPGIRIR